MLGVLCDHVGFVPKSLQPPAYPPESLHRFFPLPHIPHVISKIDGFVISPISALRFIPLSLRRTARTPHSAGFARLELGLITKPSGMMTLYRSIKIDVLDFNNQAVFRREPEPDSGRPGLPDPRGHAAAHRPPCDQVGGRRPHPAARRHRPAARLCARHRRHRRSDRRVSLRLEAVPAGHIPPRRGGPAQPSV